MKSSGERINYNLRTAKAVERRMIVSAIKEIMKQNTHQYRYVGFGSFYFTDFKLFHRELHIDKMVTIEGKVGLAKRVKFNRPYDCIEVAIGNSNTVLPSLTWTNEIKDFDWFDYDGALNISMFKDVDVFFSKASPGSIYLMSCNKQFPSDYTKEKAEEEYGELIPFGITNTDFNGENDFKTIRMMFTLAITNVINQRNLTIPNANDKLVFEQLFYFTYRDGAPMVTFGGLLTTAGDAFTLQKYNLQAFEFIARGNVPFDIAPPNITNKEYYFLNKFLPKNEVDFLAVRGIDFIKQGDLKNYRALYKYLPYYMDVQM